MTAPTQPPSTIPSSQPDRGGVGNPSRRLQRDFPTRGDLPALKKVRSSKNARRVAIVLMVSLVATGVMMAFSPWQQTVRADGSVINYDPTARPQNLQAPITGRVSRLGEGIGPNVRVKKGQLIAEMVDLDPDRLARLESQLENLRQSARFARQGVDAAMRERTQAQLAVEVYRSNVETLKAVKRETVAAAEAQIEVARQKLEAAEKVLTNREAVLEQAEADYRRQKQLFAEEIASELKFQLADQKYKSAQASVGEAKADIAAATEEISGKIKERNSKEESAEAAIKTANATLTNAEAKVQSAEASVAKAEQEFQKATQAATEAETSVSRQSNQKIEAPFTGQLVEIYADAGSKVMKQGDLVARIVPESEDRIVQVWLDGNDAPLVEPGRHVRLQFEGWPAIQFTGWPSVAVGTFGGEVLSVDATDDGHGKFRALIGEVKGLDESTGLIDEPWPHGRFLRPGVRANSWVLLETVPMWWEVWRNLNGFPPVVDTEHEDRPAKAPKLPK